MLKKKIYISLILLLFVSSCGDSWDSFKRGMTGQKQVSTDEFLVKKKDPLILPPDYDKLPTPGKNSITEEQENDFEKILNIEDISDAQNMESSNNSLEESVLEKIRNN